jgi:hypothetical protein
MAKIVHLFTRPQSHTLPTLTPEWSERSPTTASVLGIQVLFQVRMLMAKT